MNSLIIQQKIEVKSVEELLTNFYQIVEIEESWTKNHEKYKSDYNITIGPTSTINYVCKKVLKK